MQKELPSRKNNRLSGYDYSATGYYFITLCAKSRNEIFGRIIVGDAPLRVPPVPLTAPFLEPTEYGVFVDMQIKKINHVYPYVLIDKYVIMPNHVHMIIVVISGMENKDITLSNTENGTRRGASPTKTVIPKIVQSLKSMTTKHFGLNIWQRSYHDHIIRDEADYQLIWQYIDDNPSQWAEDNYFIPPTAR